MNQEEYLDQLLEARRYGRSQPPMNNDEITASLAAAEMLARLQKIEVPADLTRRLEMTLRTHMNSRGLAQPNNQTLLNENVLPLARVRSANTRRAPKRRAWAVMVSVAAMLILAFAGLLALSAHTLPGGSLSGQKRVGAQATSSVGTTDPQSPVDSSIVHLRNALVDLRNDVNNQSSDAVIKLALQTVASRTHDCQNAVAAVPTGPERDAAQQKLNAALAEEEQTARQLLVPLDWPMRLLFTHQLGVLGDLVPTITDVSVLPQSNGTYLITLTGTHFTSQSKLMLNGQSVGSVSVARTGQLVATLPGSQGYPDRHAFGILNPDGTAAQYEHTGEDDHTGSGTSTPYPDH